MPNIVTPISSLIPNPEIPTGDASNMIIDNKVKTKKISIKFVCCPNDKNNKKNSNASIKFLTNVINISYIK